MTKDELKQARSRIYKENLRWPVALTLIAKKDWPEGSPNTLLALWRSRTHFAQVHQVQNGIEQLIITRTIPDKEGLRMAGGISHSDIQRLKREMGYGEANAVEIFPKDSDFMDSQGARYIWVLPKRIPFAFSKTKKMANAGLGGLIHHPDEHQPMSGLLQPRDKGAIIITDEDHS